MVIGVDLDDVLLNFFGTFCTFVNRTKGTSYTLLDCWDFSIEKSWGWTAEQAHKSVADFYVSQDHITAMPIDGAVDAIKQLSKDHKLHIVTSKPDFMADQTKKWLDLYFPGMFTGVHFMNHYHGNGKKRSKAETCKELGVSVYIDDSLEQARNVAAFGISVLMPDRPWNQEKIEPPITRVYSWKEIVERVGSGK